MAQIGAVFVFCSSCKILYFASSVHPKNATELDSTIQILNSGTLTLLNSKGENRKNGILQQKSCGNSLSL